MKAPPLGLAARARAVKIGGYQLTDTSIQAFQPDNGALSAESYQTFEMAKEHDGILGGSDIAQIRSYAAYARAQAQAIHKTIAATNGIEDVAAIKSEATETAQTFAKVGIYADQRIGEILRELPTSNRWSDSPTGKTETIKESGMSTKTAYDLQALAANPDVVQAVLDKAEADGTIPSRSQVLKAIRERDDARYVADRLKEQRDQAREEVAALEQQNDRLYEQVDAQRQPQVIEREVAPADYAESKRRMQELEHLEQLHSSDNQKLRRQLEEARKELDRAKGILGMSQTMQDVRRDVQYLITATNNYVRQYGGLTWTAQSLSDVDEPTLGELTKAVRNLATFATALMASLESIDGTH